MRNFIERREVISKIKDGEYNNEELNQWLSWSMKKYAPEIIDLIIKQPDFYIIDKFIGCTELNKLVFFNDYKRFKYFAENMEIIMYTHPHGYDSGSYGLMKDICWYNKVDFLKLIVDKEELDFTRNDNIIVHKTFKNGNYEILSLLLQNRTEIKNNKELYDKYSFVLRNQKLNQLKEKIYTNK